MLPHKPCLRRVGRWIAEAGLERLPFEPLALHQCRPPWAVERTPDHFVVELPTPTRRSNPPLSAERRRSGLSTSYRPRTSPPADVRPDGRPVRPVWSDKSEREGTTGGDVGALVKFHCLGREQHNQGPRRSSVQQLARRANRNKGGANCGNLPN